MWRYGHLNRQIDRGPPGYLWPAQVAVALQYPPWNQARHDLMTSQQPPLLALGRRAATRGLGRARPVAEPKIYVLAWGSQPCVPRNAHVRLGGGLGGVDWGYLPPLSGGRWWGQLSVGSGGLTSRAQPQPARHPTHTWCGGGRSLQHAVGARSRPGGPQAMPQSATIPVKMAAWAVFRVRCAGGGATTYRKPGAIAPEIDHVWPLARGGACGVPYTPTAGPDPAQPLSAKGQSRSR